MVALKTNRKVMRKSGSVNLTLKIEGLSEAQELKATEEPIWPAHFFLWERSKQTVPQGFRGGMVPFPPELGLLHKVRGSDGGKMRFQSAQPLSSCMFIRSSQLSSVVSSVK
jgi:hypothetical protein